MAALLAGSAAACADDEAPASAQRVVLISLDTLRADHLPTYGYERDTAPALARLAADDAVVFERCYSQSSWTLPSHATMLTGLYPITHGVNDGEKRLAGEVVTLAERLRDVGLATAAFTDGGYVAPGYGLEDGFDVYHDERLGAEDGEHGLARSLPHAERWLRRHGRGSFFLFLHTYDVHAPYSDEEPWASAFHADAAATAEGVAHLEHLSGLEECAVFGLERFAGLEELVATYDGMILRTDRRLERVFDVLREMKVYDDTLIVVTSDHGESFLDAGVYAGHGLMLNDAETHVPLIVKFPANRFAGMRSAALVESVDLAPTIMAALGVPALPDQVQGHDLARLLQGEADPSPFAFSVGGGLQSEAVRGKDWTLILPVDEDGVERILSDRLRSSDPTGLLERLCRVPRLEAAGTAGGPDHLEEHPAVEERLREALAAWRLSLYADRHRRAHPEDRGAIEERELQRLRALGYL